MSRTHGTPFVVSGPSGVGKTSILKEVRRRDDRVRFSISHTTRTPRADEQEGVDYFFVDESHFRGLIERDVFLEHAEYQGNLYGTSREAVSGPTEAGFDLILEVEVQGAAQLRERMPGAILIFIVPPSMEVLEERLRGRGSDEDSVIRKRLKRAEQELQEQDRYHHTVINDDFERAVAELEGIIRKHRPQNSDLE